MDNGVVLSLFEGTCLVKTRPDIIVTITVIAISEIGAITIIIRKHQKYHCIL
jgi:hypothetical protein